MATIDDVRALIGDVVIADDTGEFLFSDEHLQTLLNLNNGSVFRAAADALRALSVDQVYLYKASLKTDDMSVDGAQVAVQLRLLATEFENKANSQDAQDAGFEIVAFDTGGRSYPEGAARPGYWGWSPTCL